jgi:hypothetical protein
MPEPSPTLLGLMGISTNHLGFKLTGAPKEGRSATERLSRDADCGSGVGIGLRQCRPQA